MRGLMKKLGIILNRHLKTCVGEDFLQWVDPNYEILPGIGVPIVYRDEFSLSSFLSEETISLYEVRSRWDFKRYNKIATALVEDSEAFKIVDSFDQFVPSIEVSDEFTLKHHTADYLSYLHTMEGFSEVFCLAKSVRDHLEHNLPLLQMFLRSMKYRVGGTILAAELARATGFSVILGGSGSHHAHASNGEGWCGLGDIQLAVVNFREKYEDIRKIMIIDLDAHQSNGITIDLCDGKLGVPEEEIFLVDVFNEDIFPARRLHRNKEEEEEEEEDNTTANVSIGCRSGISDTEYLRLVEQGIDEGLERFGVAPDFVFFVAGSDILSGDVYGKFDVSSEGLMRRDEIVFEKVYDRLDVPVCMTMGGGYLSESWRVVVESLKRLQKKFEIVDYIMSVK